MPSRRNQWKSGGRGEQKIEVAWPAEGRGGEVQRQGEELHPAQHNDLRAINTLCLGWRGRGWEQMPLKKRIIPNPIIVSFQGNTPLSSRIFSEGCPPHKNLELCRVLTEGWRGVTKLLDDPHKLLSKLLCLVPVLPLLVMPSTLPASHSSRLSSGISSSLWFMPGAPTHYITYHVNYLQHVVTATF